MRNVLLTAAVASLLLAAPASAQLGTASTAKSTTSGVFLGLHLNGSAITGKDFTDGTENGGGLGVQIGYGFTPHFALYVEGTGASLSSSNDVDGDYTLGHGDIGLRYSFANPARAFVPYLNVALSGRAARQSDAQFEDGTTGDITLSGTGVTFGGGLQYFFTRAFALNTSLAWTTGKFDKLEAGGESINDLGIKATSSRFNLGVSWYPGSH